MPIHSYGGFNEAFACWGRSGISHQPKPKSVIIDNLQRRLRNLFYFNQTASAIPGSIHFIAWFSFQRMPMPVVPQDAVLLHSGQYNVSGQLPQQLACLEDRQAHYSAVAARYVFDEQRGMALYAVAAGLAHGLAGGTIRVDFSCR